MKKLLICLAAMTILSCTKEDKSCYLFETTVKTVYSYAPNDPRIEQTRREECDLTESDAKARAEAETYKNYVNQTVTQYYLTTYYKLKK